MTKIDLFFRAALMSAALLAALPGARAAGQAPKSGDACFKRVYDKTASTGRWLVKECVKEADIFFQVDFRDAALREYTTVLKTANDDMGSDSHNYTVVAGDSLAIDIFNERGGQAIFLHPVTDTNQLSSVEVRYMNRETGAVFKLKRTGNTISLKTSVDDIAIAIGPDGRLKNVTKPVKGGAAAQK